MANLQDRIKSFRRVKASQLLASPKNYRTHGAEQTSAVSSVLAEIGIADALIAREDEEGRLVLIDGHLRQGLDPDQKWPVMILDVSEEEADLLLATLDPLSAMAGTDAGLLEDLLGDMGEFDSGDINDLLASLAKDAGIDGPEIIEDEIPEPPDDPITKQGDLWLLGDHRLLCGDATKAEDVERVMAGDLAQMIFTDPPYGVAYTGGAKKREVLQGDVIGTDIYKQFLPNAFSFSDENTSLYLWYADGHAAAAAAAAAGFQIVAQIIWAKNHAQFMTSAHYKGKHEPCYYGHKKGKSARWNGENNEVTLWEYPRSPKNEHHPTQKPVAIAARAIGNSSEEGDVVADYFLGGGTTIMAAEQLDRKCYGLEISPAYCDVVVERWEQATGLQAKLDKPTKSK